MLCNNYNFVDLTGKKFNLLSVVEYTGKSMWICRCECGKLKTIHRSNLKKAKSCGCQKDRLIGLKNKKHGLCGTSEYAAWNGMKTRCLNPRCDSYQHYGARGIRFCEEWSKFENFFRDMGKKPSPEYTLDRKDVNKDYCAENCKWSSPIEQERNKRCTRFFELDGVRLSLGEWAERTGINYQTLYSRVTTKKWSFEKAISKP